MVNGLPKKMIMHKIKRENKIFTYIMFKNSLTFMVLLIIFIIGMSFYNEYSSEHSKEGYRIIGKRKCQ